MVFRESHHTRTQVYTVYNPELDELYVPSGSHLACNEHLIFLNFCFFPYFLLMQRDALYLFHVHFKLISSLQAGLGHDAVLERLRTLVPPRTVVRVRAATSLEAKAAGVAQTTGTLVAEFRTELNARYVRSGEGSCIHSKFIFRCLW